MYKQAPILFYQSALIKRLVEILKNSRTRVDITVIKRFKVKDFKPKLNAPVTLSIATSHILLYLLRQLRGRNNTIVIKRF